MKNKIPKILSTFLLTSMLVTGIIFPACEDEMNGGLNCDCSTPYYFDIKGLYIRLLRQEFGARWEMKPMDSIRFENFGEVALEYDIDYVSQIKTKKKRGFSISLLPKLYACSCIPPSLGSKEEELLSFEVITLNDFDEDHKANSNINDLLIHRDIFSNEKLPLREFLDSQKGLLKEPRMWLSLAKAPELNAEFKVKIRMELSTGEVYEIETEPIFILP